MLNDRLDFIEFKQGVLFYKEPNHKASVFYELSLEDFVVIRDYTKMYEDKIERNEKVSLNDYEFKLYSMFPSLKSYLVASKLTAKVLMKKENYEKLFTHSN